jgi:hypothetical protein
MTGFYQTKENQTKGDVVSQMTKRSALSVIDITDDTHGFAFIPTAHNGNQRRTFDG